MVARLQWTGAGALAPGAMAVPVVLVSGIPVVLTPAGVRPTTVASGDLDPLWWPGAGTLTETLPDSSTFDPVKDLLDPSEVWETYETASITDGSVTVEHLRFSVLDPAGAATALLSIRDARPSAFLTADIAAADTSLSLASSAVFASSGIAAIGAETVTYSGKTSTTLTGLARGKYGSRGRAHLSPVSHRPLVTYGGGRHWQGRTASVWLCGLSADGTTLSRPTLIYLGTVGAGVALTSGLTRWSVPLDHVTTTLARKIASQGVELYGVAHFDTRAPSHPLGLLYIRGGSVYDATLDGNPAYPHDGGWHPDWASFARAAHVYAQTVGGGYASVTSSPEVTAVRFAGTDADPIDASVDAPWHSLPHWEGHCTTWTGISFVDGTPGAHLHLEGLCKIGAAEDFARIPATVAYFASTTDGGYAEARIALVADTDETPGCVAAIIGRDATAQTVTLAASLPGRSRMTEAQLYSATRITSRTSALLGLVVQGTGPVACMRAAADALDAMTGLDAYAVAVDWDDMERAFAAAPIGVTSQREYRFTGGADSFLSVLRDECRVRGMVLAIRHGKITARRLQSFADIESTVMAVTELDGISADGAEITPEVTDSTEPLATSVEFEVATGNGGTRTVTITDTTWQGEGGDGETIKVGALRWLPTSEPLPDVTPVLVDVAQQILGPTAEPHRVIRLTASPRLMSLQPGDLVTLTHTRIPTWSGTRGVTDGVCQVVDVRRSVFGGLLRAVVALRLGSGTRVGYAPSALVAAGGISGAVVTLDTSSAWGATCFASDTTATGEAAVNAADGFAVGQAVTLHALGSRSPIASEDFTVTAVTATSITLDAAPSAGMIAAAAAQYGAMITLDSYAAQSTATRASWAFIADDSTGLYSNSDAATRWGA